MDRNRSLPGVAAVAALLLLAAGCGSTDGDAAGAPCPAVDATGPTEIDVVLPDLGLGDNLEVLTERYNDVQDDVVVDVRLVAGPVYPHLLAADPPALAAVSPDALRGLRVAGAITPIDGCLTLDPHALDTLEPATVAGGQLDGEQWSVPWNMATSVTVYDRAAFAAAGLDPDRAPATLDELLDAATRLVAAGHPTPVAVRTPGWLLLVSGVDLGPTAVLDGSEALAVADALAALARAGVVAQPVDPVGPGDFPLARGDAVIEIGVEPQELWALADAIADGQAPGVDLGVAPLPGLTGPAVPVGSLGLVLGASASPAERGAAWSYLKWLLRPEQQLELHIAADVYPTDPAAARLEATGSYWSGLALLGDGYRAIVHPVTRPSTVPGTHQILNTALIDVLNGAEPQARMHLAAAELAALQREAADPLAELECQVPDPPGPPPCDAEDGS